MATDDLDKIFQKLRVEITRILDRAARQISRGRQVGPNAARQIPAGITKRLDYIKDFLEQIQTTTKADIVNMRLNESNTEAPAPVFVGWVESETIKEIRRGRNERDPGTYRLGDDIPSQEYDETLSAAARGQFAVRNWAVHLRQKNPEQMALVPRAGVMHQTLIGIVVEQGNVCRCIGALNLAFTRPTELTFEQSGELKLDNPKLQEIRSKLKTFTDNLNLEFGGPTFPK